MVQYITNSYIPTEEELENASTTVQKSNLNDEHFFGKYNNLIFL